MTQMENEKPVTEPIRVIGMQKNNIVRIGVACIVVVSLVILSYFFLSPPTNFPSDTVVTISSGETLKSVVENFRTDHIIRSSTLFQSLVVLLGGEKKVIAGDYLLKNSEGSLPLALRIVRGDFGMVEVKVTIPEGFSVANIGDLLEEKLVKFDKEQFLQIASPKEGYLFPDTYFFPPTASSSDIVTRMQNNFNVKIQPFGMDILKSGHSESDILKMASILEGEATSTKDRQIVAGILWSRIKQGIPLQVDSTLKYITGKTSAQLTVSDLKINSPYNTYVYRGLPPTPINNPGLDSISATLHPIATKYVYFLTGKDGVMHYAVTFAEHEKNIQKYL
jgi:UPF0755 protein